MIFFYFPVVTLVIKNYIFQNKFRGDYSIDQFIDIVVGNRIYMPCLYVFNKIDQISLEEVDRIARTKNSGLKIFLKMPRRNTLKVTTGCAM